MSSFVITNISVYKAISEDAHLKMHDLLAASRKPKPAGDGWIVNYDPEQRSFKQAMISIVFMGMWLEALIHLLIMREYGEQKFKEYDRKSYEEKLKLLGCSDQNILNRVASFRKCRKELVHEKAGFDTGEIKIAQKEADNAHELLNSISEHFSNQQG